MTSVDSSGCLMLYVCFLLYALSIFMSMLHDLSIHCMLHNSSVFVCMLHALSAHCMLHASRYSFVCLMTHVYSFNVSPVESQRNKFEIVGLEQLLKNKTLSRWAIIFNTLFTVLSLFYSSRSSYGSFFSIFHYHAYLSYCFFSLIVFSSCNLYRCSYNGKEVNHFNTISVSIVCLNKFKSKMQNKYSIYDTLLLSMLTS